MKKSIVLALIVGASALNLNAGVVRFAYKHAAKPAFAHTVKPAAKTATFPARHPKKTAKFVAKVAKKSAQVAF